MVAGLYYLWFNLITNLRRLGLPDDFSFLDNRTGFRITGTNFDPANPVLEAFLVGARNTLLVAAVGIAISAVLGVLVGIARLSSNWLVRRAATVYVETLRNVPVLVVIIFFSAAVILSLPSVDNPIEWLGAIALSKRGLWIPSLVAGDRAGLFLIIATAAVAGAVVLGWWRTKAWERTGQPHRRILSGLGLIAVVVVAAYVALGGPIAVSFPVRTQRSVAGGTIVSPELAALLAGLVVYTTSHIAEVVRGSIQAIPKGQVEAASAVGLRPGHRMRYVILPQALRIATPSLGNQFLNLTKNSSLAVAIGYPDLMRVARISIGSGVPAPQAIAIVMLIYLTISLFIAALVNLANWRLSLATRR